MQDNGNKLTTMKNFNEFDKHGCYSLKKIIAVTLPILLSMLMEHIIGMTDTAFLGRVSEVALGASALGTVYFLAFFVLGSGFSFGAQILIARRNGEKNFKNIGEICYAGGFFLLIFSLLLCFAATSPVTAVLYLSLIYTAVSLINTSLLSIYPIRFLKSGNVASVSGLMDFATYLGGGIGSVLYGVLILHFGYLPMFASWAAVSLLSLLIFARVRRSV